MAALLYHGFYNGLAEIIEKLTVVSGGCLVFSLSFTFAFAFTWNKYFQNPKTENRKRV